MVDFAGYHMPIQYAGGINEEHLVVRSGAGLFDVSHMAEILVTGKDALEFVQFACVNDASKLRINRGQYSMIPNAEGGLIDDVFVYRTAEESYLIVANAANREPVVTHLTGLAAEYDVEVVDISDDYALLALQGPDAQRILAPLMDVEVSAIRRNALQDGMLGEVYNVTLSRTGYTGEDGFEIFCEPADAVAVWNILTEAGAVPCGLGSRDTLRLEAGFPLFGNDLGPDTNPRCTPFAWVVKDKPVFGYDALFNDACEQRLVAFVLTGRGLPRPGYTVLHGEKPVGVVSSGTLVPGTKQAIGFAWIAAEHAEPGTAIAVEIRNKPVAAEVVQLPFTQA